METLTITAESNDVTVEVDIDRLHSAICEHGITGNEDGGEVPYFYLAALALGCHNDEEYDLNRTLMEFINNSSELDVSGDAADRIEDLLR